LFVENGAEVDARGEFLFGVSADIINTILEGRELSVEEGVCPLRD
jgi:hypothetical protein